MGLGKKRRDGTYEPITPISGAWYLSVNNGIPDHVKKAFLDRFAATHSNRLTIGTITLAELMARPHSVSK